MKNSVNNTINWKFNSQLSLIVMIPRHFEYVFTDRTVLLHLAAIECIDHDPNGPKSLCLSVIPGSVMLTHIVLEEL